MLAQLTDDDGTPIDEVVATFFRRPRSYTGEDVVEISCHGSPVILRRCVELAVAAGARLAEPGEFTFRAFLNGRLDLPRAEAVRDLIEATTLYQARVAAQQLQGALSQRLAPSKQQLLDLIALLEAGIDFADDDVPVASQDEIVRRIDEVAYGVERLYRTYDWGRFVHSGITLAIVGRPNVGKSSLFNALLEQDRAIVTDIPGTTRDTVSEQAVIEGLPVRLLDTAGIREGQDRVELLGIERSLQAMADADLILVVFDLSIPFEESDRHILDRARATGRYLLIGNKADLPPCAEPGEPHLRVSAQTGAGMGELRKAIVHHAGAEQEAEYGFITNVRHAELLRQALTSLTAARHAAAGNIPHEMILLDLYSALHALDAITGATTAEDILNRIFSTFCIGK